MPEEAFRPEGEAVERSDIHPRPVLGAAALLLLALALAAGAIGGLLRAWQVPVDAAPGAPKDFTTPGPGLQAAPQDERAAYFAEKEKLLHSYGWVDRQAGTARIPIEVAMDLLAAREEKGGKPAPGAAP